MSSCRTRPYPQPRTRPSMTEPKSYKWFLDFLNPEEGHMHGIRTMLYSAQTKFQRMEIMETGSYGRCLVLDGKMQSSEFDEFIYHEALVHPAMLTHPDPKRVFIVEACKTYLPEMHAGAFDDPRVRLEYRDARAYLEQTSDVYDVIVIDISEP